MFHLTESFYLFFMQMSYPQSFIIGRTSLRKQIESTPTCILKKAIVTEGAISLPKERCLIRGRRSSYILTLCRSAFFLLDSDADGKLPSRLSC